MNFLCFLTGFLGSFLPSLPSSVDKTVICDRQCPIGIKELISIVFESTANKVQLSKLSADVYAEIQRGSLPKVKLLPWVGHSCEQSQANPDDHCGSALSLRDASAKTTCTTPFLTTFVSSVSSVGL